MMRMLNGCSMCTRSKVYDGNGQLCMEDEKIDQNEIDLKWFGHTS